MKQWTALLALLALVGCGSPDQYFPTTIGSTSSFVLRGDRRGKTTMTNRRVLSVGGARGIEVEGPNGTSRLAWIKSALVASELSNARLDPPLPVLDLGLRDVQPNKPLVDDQIRTWSGTLSYLSRTEQAKASLSQRSVKLMYKGKSLRAIEATLVLTTPIRKMEIVSTFAAGIGLMSQQHRTNDLFDFELVRD